MNLEAPEKLTWSREEGIALAKLVEDIVPEYGGHVALTGGLLYKEGERKDADLLFYRIRQHDRIDEDGLFAALAPYGIIKVSDHGFVKKADFFGKSIDMLFPEQCAHGAPTEGTYP